ASITARHLELTAAESRPTPQAADETSELLEVLERTGWNVTHAAEALGLTRNALRYRIQRHGLRPEAGRRVPRRRRAVAVPAGRPRAAVLRWERRPVTVLRSLVVPATGATSDASGLLEVLVEKVTSFGGVVEGLGASSLTAVFGLAAVEDPATRAALAAL